MFSANTTISHHYLSDDFRPSSSEVEMGEPGLRHTTNKEYFWGISPSFDGEGWETVRFLGENDFSDLKALLTRHIKNLLATHQPVNPDFRLEDYHKHLSSDEVHYAISSWAMSADVIGKHYIRIKNKMEAISDASLTTKEIEHNGIKGHFLGFRVVRPGKPDHNPYHRDAWLPYWRNTVNVWIPICGFENGNTISLIPGTHTLDDTEILKTKRGAVIGGKTYHVPAAVALNRSFERITPDLNAGEGLIFSPYLLHGNGINTQIDCTRVSIELRFCKF